MHTDKETGRLSLEKTPKSFFEILLVDDEASVRHLLRSILNSNGYTRLDEAESGEEALNKLAAGQYHLILVDKNLPGIDGLEVLKRAKELQPNAEVIVITAYGSMESVIQAMDVGAFGYINKPFSEIDIVIDRVESALKRAANSHQINNLLIRLDRVLEHLGKSRTEQSLPAVLERVDEALGRLASIVNELKRLSVQGKKPE
jgi:DNA-binding NtrC family response regulator